MVQRIFELMEKNEINATELAKATGIGTSPISQWKKGLQKPSTEAVIKIADYFGTSTDYLLGRTDIKEPVYAPGKKNNSQHSRVDAVSRGCVALSGENENNRVILSESEKIAARLGLKRYFEAFGHIGPDEYLEKRGISQNIWDDIRAGKRLPTHKEFWHMMGVFSPFDQAPMECFKLLAILVDIEGRKKSDDIRAAALIDELATIAEERVAASDAD